MVARIKRTQSLSRSLNYNEKKVQLRVAECIQAVNYPKDLEALNFYEKLHRLEHQAELNERGQSEQRSYLFKLSRERSIEQRKAVCYS